MRLIRSAACLILTVVTIFTAQTEALAATKAKPASSISAYDSSLPQNLTEDNLYAQSAILIEAKTGRVLFEKDSERLMYPASTTKLMTALLVVENLDMDDIVTCSVNAVNSEATWIPVKKGEEFTVEQLLHALLLISANDAAIALAEAVSGSVKDFAELMNQRASELGCENTVFKNANGLPNTSHHTTVSDMAKIAREAYKSEIIRTVMATDTYKIPPTNKREEGVTLRNKNAFLKDSGNSDFSYPYGVGMKTGYTNDAQQCFVGAAVKDGLELISVVFGSTSDGKWLDTAKLMDYGFSKLDYINVAALYASKSFKMPVKNGLEDDVKQGMIELVIDPEQESLLSKYYDIDDVLDSIKASPSDYLTVTALSESVTAPISADQVLGRLSFATDALSEPIVVDLVPKNAVAAKPIPPTAPIITLNPEATEGAAYFPDASPDTKRKLLGYLLLIPAAIIAAVACMLLYASLKQARAQKRRLASQIAVPKGRPQQNSYTRYKRR